MNTFNGGRVPYIINALSEILFTVHEGKKAKNESMVCDLICTRSWLLGWVNDRRKNVFRQYAFVISTTVCD